MELIAILMLTLGALYIIIKGAVKDGILAAQEELTRRAVYKEDYQ